MNLMATANHWRRFRLDVQGKRHGFAWRRVLHKRRETLEINPPTAAKQSHASRLARRAETFD